VSRVNFKQLICVTTIAFLLFSVAAHADSKKKSSKGITIEAHLSGAQEVPASGPGLIERAKITIRFERT
jgi:hypothetical protein